MVLVDVELVGVTLIHSRGFGTFRVENVHLVKVVQGETRFVVQKGRDYKPRISFEEIVCAFSDAYEVQTTKIWTSTTWYVTKRYFQLKKLCSPKFVGLPGRWRCWAER